MTGPAIVKRTHEGKLFSVEIVQVRDDDGELREREVVRHPGAVLVLPVLDEERIVLIRNYRAAPDQTLWELPAGKLEPGEDPQAAAARELAEETGYVAKRIRKLGTFYTSPGFADELMHVFVAEQLTPGSQRLEPGEQIEVHIIERNEALRMAMDGTLIDGKSIAALLMWDRQRTAHAQDSVVHS